MEGRLCLETLFFLPEIGQMYVAKSGQLEIFGHLKDPQKLLLEDFGPMLQGVSISERAFHLLAQISAS